MSLKEEVGRQIKEALRRGEKKRLGVLRMVMSELNVAGASGKDVDEQQVVHSYAGTLRKTAREYEELDQAERAQEIRRELQVVEEFLPEQMDRTDVEEMVENLIADNEWGPRDIGRLMKTVMSQYGDRVDGGVVHQVAREQLAESD